MTTTPSSSHISDFRKQKRTDSRADKPDVFPGFDLQVDSTTPSSRKRRRQAYSKLIRLFLQNTKDRLENIRDIIKDESELHFRMIRPSSDDELTESIERNTEIKFSDDENRQFIDFAFADTTNDNREKNENDDRDNASQTYLNSLFAAVGYRRITTTSNPIESDEMTQSNHIARYLLNPLLNAWAFTRERFTNGANNTAIDYDDRNNNDHTSIFRVNFFDNQPKMHTNLTTNVSNKEHNENNVNNFNYSLPLTQHTSKNVTSVMQTTNETRATAEMITITKNANKVNPSSELDVDYNNEHHGSDKKPRNTLRNRNSVEEAAAEAFRNAFLKYSNYMQDSTEDAQFDTVTVRNMQFEQNNSNEMKSDKLLDGAFFTGNLFDTNSSHIQIVPNKKQKINGSISENVDINFENNDSIESTKKSFGEKSAVLLLEIFGTVIGMTWRAVSEIPNYFNTQTQNGNA